MQRNDAMAKHERRNLAKKRYLRDQGTRDPPLTRKKTKQKRGRAKLPPNRLQQTPTPTKQRTLSNQMQHRHQDGSMETPIARRNRSIFHSKNSSGQKGRGDTDLINSVSPAKEAKKEA